ncbi:MAG: hypothetical protein ACPGTO_10205 [Polaribacter sp.]
MHKVNKIDDQELKTIVDQQKQLNDILLQIGGLETQKHSLLHRIKSVNEGIEETKKSLEEKYGTININLEDGTYTEIKKEDE